VVQIDAIHVWSHPKPKYVQMAVDEERAEQDVVCARMLEHDEHVGAILQELKNLGANDNTIVIYTTDNGNEMMFWPMEGMLRSPERREPARKVVCASRASSSGRATF